MAEENNKDESEKTEEKANEEIKKSRIEIVASAKSLLLWFFFKIRYLFLNLWAWIKINPTDFLTLLLALGTFSMALSTCQLVVSNNDIVDITRQANERTEKLFVSQNKPLVIATPIGIILGVSEDEHKMCTTLFSVINHSGFVAYNIVIDVAYEGNVWISEWLEAEKDRKKKEDDNMEEKGVIIGRYYSSIPKKKSIQKLNPSERKIIGFTGSLDVEERVSSKGKEGFPVLVRIRWENDRGRVFDETHQHKLTSTAAGTGRSFTFIPEGIISQKN